MSEFISRNHHYSHYCQTHITTPFTTPSTHKSISYSLSDGVSSVYTTSPFVAGFVRIMFPLIMIVLFLMVFLALKTQLLFKRQPTRMLFQKIFLLNILYALIHRLSLRCVPILKQLILILNLISNSQLISRPPSIMMISVT